MRLINTSTLKLHTFPDERGIKYAILSHRWQEEEVLFEHISIPDRSNAERLKGFDKLKRACSQARFDEIDYIWIDTCCIDKSSSAELQEAINSMFRWYSVAEVCYAYIFDYSFEERNSDFSESEWFERGWTLQELIAPKRIQFFDMSWINFGDRQGLSQLISERTGIRTPILCDGYSLDNMPPITEIMCWAKGRQTTRIEDQAYSLIGLFGVNMAMLYGEGENAFRRLQEEIIRSTEDQSIFAWQVSEENKMRHLATSPDDFTVHVWPRMKGAKIEIERRSPHSITNEGVSVSVALIPWVPYVYLALLNLEIFYLTSSGLNQYAIGIFLERLRHSPNTERYARCLDPKYQVFFGEIPLGFRCDRTQITIVKRYEQSDLLYNHVHFTTPNPIFRYKLEIAHSGIPTNFEVETFGKSQWNGDEMELKLVPDLLRCAGSLTIQRRQPNMNTTKIYLGMAGSFRPLVMMKSSRWTRTGTIEDYFYEATSTEHKNRWKRIFPSDRRLHRSCNIFKIMSGLCTYDKGLLVLTPEFNMFPGVTGIWVEGEIDRPSKDISEPFEIKLVHMEQNVGCWSLEIKIDPYSEVE